MDHLSFSDTHHFIKWMYMMYIRVGCGTSNGIWCLRWFFGILQQAVPGATDVRLTNLIAYFWTFSKPTRINIQPSSPCQEVCEAFFVDYVSQDQLRGCPIIAQKVSSSLVSDAFHRDSCGQNKSEVSSMIFQILPCGDVLVYWVYHTYMRIYGIVGQNMQCDAIQHKVIFSISW